MPSLSRPVRRSLLLSLSLFALITAWMWDHYVLVPANTRTAASRHFPVGNTSDLYARWLGSRELLLHHRNPYGVEVTREIQAGFYGRPLNPHNPDDPRDKQAFAYPIYIAFLLSPSLSFPFSQVQLVCRWLFVLLVAASVPMWSHAVGWPKSTYGIVVATILVLATFPIFLIHHMQNLGAVACFLLAASFVSLVEYRLALSGFLLALSTFKPDITLPVVSFLMVWSFADVRQRWRLPVFFAISMCCLVGFSELVCPHWIPDFVSAVRAYPTYAGEPSIVQAFTPEFAVPFVSSSLMLLAFVIVWAARKHPENSFEFLVALSTVITATLSVIPKLSPYNQLILIPPFLFLGRAYSSGRLSFFSRASVRACFVIQTSFWVSALVVLCMYFLHGRVPPSSKIANIPLASLIFITPALLLTTISLTWEKFLRKRQATPEVC